MGDATRLVSNAFQLLEMEFFRLGKKTSNHFHGKLLHFWMIWDPFHSIEEYILNTEEKLVLSVPPAPKN